VVNGNVVGLFRGTYFDYRPGYWISRLRLSISSVSPAEFLESTVKWATTAFFHILTDSTYIISKYPVLLCLNQSLSTDSPWTTKGSTTYA